MIVSSFLYLYKSVKFAYVNFKQDNIQIVSKVNTSLFLEYSSLCVRRLIESSSSTFWALHVFVSTNNSARSGKILHSRILISEFRYVSRESDFYSSIEYCANIIITIIITVVINLKGRYLFLCHLFRLIFHRFVDFQFRFVFSLYLAIGNLSPPFVL